MSENTQSIGHDAGHKDRWYHRKYNNPHPQGSQLHKDYDDAYRGKHKQVMKGFKTFDRTGNEVVKEATALDKFRAAAAEREKEANKREAEMKARHAAGKEDMKGAIDTLAQRLNKEEVELEESDAAWSASKEKEKQDRLTTGDKDKLDAVKSMLAKEKKPVKESFEEAEEHKDAAESAKEAGDKHSYHMHMSDHHGALANWHYSKGRNTAGDKHSGKAADHEMAAHQIKKMKEEVAANNVGSGNIAGTQGDAGKKVVMTKEPLKRKKLTDFKEWVELDEYAIDAKGHKSSTGGLTQKGVDAYNRKTGGNLQTAVTTPPSKLDPDSKAAKRRKSFCARMGGMPGPMKDEKGRPTRKALALRKWNC